MLALLALGSSVVWGTSDFIAGLKAKTLPAAAVVGWSQAIALLGLTLLVVVTGGWDFTGWPAWAVLAGSAGTAALVCFYSALSTGTMGVVAPIASLGVVVPVVLGLVAGEQPSAAAYVGIAVAVVGILLVSGPELSGAVSARPLVLAAIAAAGFGITLFALDRGARYSLPETLWGMRATSVLVFAVVALTLRRTGGVGTRDLPVLALVGVADVSANALFATASSRGLVSVAGVLGSLYPITTVLLARIVLHERLRHVQVVGVGLSAVGVALIAT